MDFSVSRSVKMDVFILKVSKHLILCLAFIHFHFSLWSSTETNMVQIGACKAFAFHWNLVAMRRIQRCALLRLNRNTFRITLFQISIHRSCRRGRDSPHWSEPCKSPVQPAPLFHTVSLSVLTSTEQCRPSGLPSGRRFVSSGTNSADHHGCLHTHCSSSYSSQVSTGTKFNSLHFN